MPRTPEDQITQYKAALREMRQNKAHFSDDAFAQIIMLLLEKVRYLQTEPQMDGAKTDEMRLVTVMFVDVKDSTTMVQSMDTSDWKAMIARAHEKISGLVEQYGGQVGQYLGDGVLCFFGAQHSKGNDAIDAVSCALDVQAVTQEYAAEVRDQYDTNFSLRIGISTGRLVVGMIGSAAKQELLALGPATNLAARLQGIAPTDGIVIDAATYSRVRRQFIIHPQDAIDIKGFDTPIKHYHVVGRRTHQATQFTETRIQDIDMQLVGREEDQALLIYLMDKALDDNEFHSVVLMGDVGMGKSRLLQEAATIGDSSYQVIVMTAQYEKRNLPYNLLRSMLKVHTSIDKAMPLEEIRGRISEFVWHWWRHPNAGNAAEALGFLSGFDGFRKPSGNAVDWVIQWLTVISEKEPLLLLVDNLQWADTQSVSMLQTLATQLQHRSGLLLAAARPDYRTVHPNYMGGYPHHTRIVLDRLQSAYTFQLIDSVLHHVDRVPTKLPMIINERAEGNPLFVHEFLSNLFDNGVIQRDDNDKWRFNIVLYDVALNTLPNGLISILQSRLDDLSAESRQIIQIASVAGQKFWQSAVQEMSGDPDTDSILARLTMRGMLIEHETSDFEGEREYSFRHSLYREVAYEMLTRSQREAYHQQMANWLLSHVSDHHDYYPVLAEQFLNSGQSGASLYTYLEAVEDHLRHDQFASALNLIDRSLGIANKVPRDEALPIVSKLWSYRSQALVTLGRYDEASAASQSALMLLNELPEDYLVQVRILAERMLGLAYAGLGRYNDAYDALTRAHNLLPYDASAQMSAVLSAFGRLFLYQGRLQDSHAYQKRAYNLAQKAQDNRYITMALSQLGMIDIEQGQYADALDCYDQTLLINRQRGFEVAEAEDLLYQGILYLSLMLPQQALDSFNAALRIETEVHSNKRLIDAYRALALIMTDRVNEGLPLLKHSYEQGHKSFYGQQMLQLAYIQGLAYVEDYVNCHEQSIAFLQQVDDMNAVLKARGLMWMGISAYHLGNPNAASNLKEALELERGYGGGMVWLGNFLMGQVEDDPIAKHFYYTEAAEQLRDIGDLLVMRPDLHAAFMSSSRVQHILQKGGSSSSPFILAGD